MPTEPDDRLLDTALALTDRRPVDWASVRQALPGEAAAVDGLEAVSTIAEGHGNARADEAADEVVAPIPAVFAWGRLEARQRIGAGAYGEVWSAWDRGLDREVALKLRHPDGGGSARRWLEEARRLAQVRHPNVVTVHGADEHDARAGLWMDRLHGRTLEDLLSLLGPWSAREAAAIGMDLCAALAAVHGAGLVHGDLKTQNVMREGAPGHPGGAGRIVLMDFGSAQASASPVGDAPGTPLYSAPEVLAGGRVTPAADLYALGVVLYRLVTGRYPVDARSLEELRAKLERGEVTPLRALRPDLSPAFVQVVERALMPDPAQRFADAAAMERALASASGVERAPVRGGAWLRRAIAPAAVLLGIAAIAVAGLTAPRWRPLVFPKRPSAERLSHRLVQDWVGQLKGGLTGFAVAAPGDWDADGVPDVAVGTFGAADSRGVVAIYRGGATWSEQPQFVLEGEEADDSFGRTLAAAGDLNSDGFPDLAVGAVLSDRGGTESGAVFLFWGGPSPDTKPDLVLVGRQPGQSFGDDVASAGDVNGDGAVDLLVSAPWDDRAGRRSGRTYLFLGGKQIDAEPDAEFSLGVENGQFGEGRGIGDFNGDGVDDIAISARNAPAPTPRAGTALVYFGGRALDTNPDLVLRGEGPEQFFGALGTAGDVNGDGHPDLLVGAFMAEGAVPEAGALYVFFGGPQADTRPDLVLRGQTSKEFFGLASDGSTDFDRDGFADLLVAANGKDMSSDSAGAIFFYRGGPRIDDVPELVLRGSGVRTGFGFSIAPIGDTSGDGIPDLLVGSPGDARGASQGGSAKLFDFARYHVVRPRARDAWTAGAPATLEWTGTTRADVELSTDGGKTWKPVRSRAGGGETNVLAVDVPATAQDRVRVRIAPSDRSLQGGVATLEVPVTR